MNPNTTGGSLDGSYMPHGNKRHVMVTSYNHEGDCTPEVYTWRPADGQWQYDHHATNEAIHGMTTHPENPAQQAERLAEEVNQLTDRIYELEDEAEDG